MEKKSTQYGDFFVVTDSMADLPLGVPMPPFAPVRILAGEKEFLSKVNISAEDVLDLIKRGVTLKTAGASVKGFVDAIAQHPPGDVLVITMSSKLSGAYNAALSAARIMATRGYRVKVFDSRAGSIAEGLLVEKALELSREMSLQSALEELEGLRERVTLYMTVQDLEYLARSGRVSWAKAWVGRILGISPIITLKDGELVPFKNVRGKEKVINFMREQAEGKYTYVGSVEGDENIYAQIPGKPCRVAPGVTVHVGPGAFGVAFFR